MPHILAATTTVAASQPRAIETKYKGYRFRSRLEARWAVFFDHLNCHWLYEHQGYDIGGRPYLPDFEVNIHTADHFVEVKGDPEALDVGLLQTCAASTNTAVILLGEMPAASPSEHLLIEPGGRLTPIIFYVSRVHGLCMAPAFWPRRATQAADFLVARPAPLMVSHPKISSAYSAARSARFEHGQAG